VEERTSSLVVMGGSAGGLEALRAVAAGLPADLDAAVGIVLHLPAGSQSRLAHILSRAGPLTATQARGGERLESGRMYVAPPDRHLIVRDSRCVVSNGPHENGLRPSVDVLFRSAALAYGPRTVAVVLSGARDDGAAGAAAVEARGGTVIVQDPRDALFPGMPASAVALDHPDRVLPLDSIAPAVADAVAHLSREAPVRDNREDEMSLETEYAELGAEALGGDGPPGRSSPFSCPACGGVLWELDDEDVLRFRCRVGHAFTAESALDGQSGEVERALWTALRALQERAHLSERIATRSERNGAARSAQRFEALAREAREQADVIRRVLAGRDAPSG
jgi:two-component system chemotaxis response regulator CheB